MRPRNQYCTGEATGQAHFTLDIPKKLCDPKWCRRVPIDQWRTAKFKIAIEQEHRSSNRYNPTNESAFAWGITACAFVSRFDISAFRLASALRNDCHAYRSRVAVLGLSEVLPQKSSIRTKPGSAG